MHTNEPVVVYLAEGKLEAEMIHLMLESQGIPSGIFPESAGVAMGLTVGALGLVEVCVPHQYAEQAKALIEEMEEGKLDHEEPFEPPSD